MLVFMTAYRRRIDQYIAFRRDLLAYLDTQVRRRASAVLQNPMYHETKDRHRL
jgi:hypothetical protein